MSDKEEGQVCGEMGCEGIIQFTSPVNCSCHINPPCNACEGVVLHCPVCGWEAERIQRINDHIVKIDKATGVIKASKLRDLNTSTIDWYSFSHTHSSMIKKGCYPEGTTREDVEKLVIGTFGGRFTSFWGGRFEYIAYTD